ncbi:MAG: outer membrane beta-barrel protein [Pseudomonadales bacterium]
MKTIAPRSLLTGSLSLLATTAFASEFTGLIDMGVREVNVSGDENKYRQHVNLDDGPRLFGLELAFEPGARNSQAPDRVAVSAYGLGGDPYSSIDAEIRKYGAYNFSYQHRESEYYYDDLLIDPADVVPTASNAGDFRTFDLKRVQDAADFDIRVTDRATLSLGFDRYERSGGSTSPIDISREEFELDAPVDEVLQTYEAGFRYDWERWSLSFDQRWREFDSDTHAFLPGASEGSSPGAPTQLDSYVLDQPYGYDTSESQLGLQARLTQRWKVSADVFYADLDMDFDASETVEGTAFDGSVLSGTTIGEGDADRQTTQLFLTTSYDVTDRVRLTASIRDQSLDQDAEGFFGAAVGLADWTMDTTSYALGVETAIGDAWTVSGGWTGEERKTRYSAEQDAFAAGEDVKTSRDGFYALVTYRPGSRWNLSLSAEDNGIDDPFTLASPTDATRYRLRGSYRWDMGLSLTGTYTYRKNENDDSSWSSKTRQADVRLSYQNGPLTASLGASFVEIDRSIDQLVTGGTRQDLFLIRYDADADTVDGSLRWAVNERLALSASMRDYDNEGSFAVERQDAEVGARIGLNGGFAVDLSYRYVNFDEDDLESFDADIWQASLIYDW